MKKVTVQLKTSDNKFRVLMFLENSFGSGGFGDCYLGFYPLKHELVVIKKIRCKKEGKTKFQEWKANYSREVTLLYEASIKNRVEEFSNIVNVEPIKITSEKNRHGYIVMEYCKGGSLQNLMSQRRKSKKWFTFKEFSTIMLDVLDGYDQIASVGILHQDLKPDNIFINDGMFKIGDFGLSCKINSENLVRGGTFEYMAPEQLNWKKKVTQKIDIYSLGIMFYQLIFGFHPYFEKEEKDKFMQSEDRRAEISFNNILVGEGQFKEDENNFIKFMRTRKLKQHDVYLQYEKSEKQALKQVIALVKKMIQIQENERSSFMEVKQTIEKINLKKNPIQIEENQINVQFQAEIVQQTEQFVESVGKITPYSKLYFVNGEKFIPEIQELSEKNKKINLKILSIFQLTFSLEHEIKQHLFYDQCKYLVAKLKSLNYCFTYHAYCEILQTLKGFSTEAIDQYYAKSQYLLLKNTKSNKVYLEKEVKNYFQIRKMTVDSIRQNIIQYIKNHIFSQDICLDENNKYLLKTIVIILKLLNIDFASQESLAQINDLKAEKKESFKKIKQREMTEQQQEKQLIESGFNIGMIHFDDDDF